MHAVKAYTTTCAGTTTVKTPAPSITPTVTPTVTRSVTPAVTPTVTPAVTPTATPAAPTRGVAGVDQTSTGQPAGVAGALGALGAAAGGTLPFTGFPLWAVALAGFAAIALGWALLRRGHPAMHRIV